MLWSHPPRPPQQLRRSESPEQRVKETAKEWQKYEFCWMILKSSVWS
jgi:hypothetical protein